MKTSMFTRSCSVTLGRYISSPFKPHGVVDFGAVRKRTCALDIPDNTPSEPSLPSVALSTAAFPLSPAKHKQLATLRVRSLPTKGNLISK